MRRAAKRVAPAPSFQASVTPSSSGQYVTPSPASPMLAARKKPPKAKPKGKGKSKGGSGIPGIDQYLAGDTTYQDQASQLMRQQEQYGTSNASQQSMVGQDFQTALDKMMKQKKQDQANMTGDFGSRGLLNSGLFTKSLGDYDTNFQQQKSELDTSQQRSISQLLEDLRNYQTENASTLLAAKQDAIRRRAQKYGITV